MSSLRTVFRVIVSYSSKNVITRNFSLHELPQQYKLIQETCRKFAECELKPIASKLDREKLFPKEQILKLGSMGYMGITVSSEYGGSNLDMLSTAIIVEELSRGCASTGAIVSIHNILYGDFLDKHGTTEQKNTYLRPYTKGVPGAFALSETDAGSDVSNISTTAKEDGDFFILNGIKSWVTSAKESDIAIIFASHDRSKKHKGLTAYIVPLNLDGITIGKPENKMGIRASSTCSINLNNVKIPCTNIIGDFGNGFTLAMQQLNKARIGIASQAVGIAQASLDTAFEYATTRKAFGRPIVELQAVQMRLAKIATRIEAARLLIWKTASMCDNEMNFIKSSSIAKLFAGETATYAAHECIQILGGMGYVEDMPAERYYRDSRITEIYGGVNDIQMLIIAEQLMREYGYKKN